MDKMQPPLGNNRTGVARSKQRCEEMLRSNDEFAPDFDRDGAPIETLRKEYSKLGARIGSAPPPASMKQAAKTAKAAFTQESATLFVDKLGARLAFERGGVRLYEALLTKLDTLGAPRGGPSRAELEQILTQEREHFGMLLEAIETLGGDPTAITPSADVEAVASMGIFKVIEDARTTVLQSCEAILAAELVDNDNWEIVVALARQAGENKLVPRFERALAEEREHLAKVRGWLKENYGVTQTGVSASA